MDRQNEQRSARFFLLSPFGYREGVTQKFHGAYTAPAHERITPQGGTMSVSLPLCTGCHARALGATFETPHSDVLRLRRESAIERTLTAREKGLGDHLTCSVCALPLRFAFFSLGQQEWSQYSRGFGMASWL